MGSIYFHAMFDEEIWVLIVIFLHEIGANFETPAYWVFLEISDRLCPNRVSILYIEYTSATPILYVPPFSAVYLPLKLRGRQYLKRMTEKTT
jgi:hypothetical protein